MHQKAPDCPGPGGRRAGACAGSGGLVREPAVVRSAHVPAADPLGHAVHDLRGRRDGIGFACYAPAGHRPHRRELRRGELPAGTFGDLGQQEVLLAKTADRSVLGCMNDMAFRCEHAIAGAGGLARTDLPDLNRSLRRNINSARGYCPPIELAVRRLAV